MQLGILSSAERRYRSVNICWKWGMSGQNQTMFEEPPVSVQVHNALCSAIPMLQGFLGFTKVTTRCCSLELAVWKWTICNMEYRRRGLDGLSFWKLKHVKTPSLLPVKKHLGPPSASCLLFRAPTLPRSLAAVPGRWEGKADAYKAQVSWFRWKEHQSGNLGFRYFVYFCLSTKYFDLGYVQVIYL